MKNIEFDRLFDHLGRLEGEMIEFQKAITAIPALSPVNGGEGEWESILAPAMDQQAKSFQQFTGPQPLGKRFEEAAGQLISQEYSQGYQYDRHPSLASSLQQQPDYQNSPGKIHILFVGDDRHKPVQEVIGKIGIDKKEEQRIDLLQITHVGDRRLLIPAAVRKNAHDCCWVSEG